MLARLLIVSMLSAAVAVLSGIGLGFSGWMLLATYALVGATALVFGGALAALSSGRQLLSHGYEGGQVEPVRVHTRP